MSVYQDLRFAVRAIRRTPGLFSVAALMLALGIGANTAIFSVIRACILRPLPYRDSPHLCILWKAVPDKGIDWDWSALPVINDWRAQSRSFEDIATVIRPEAAQVVLSGRSGPERLQASKVSANLFQILGVQPLLGRTFSEREEKGRADVAVLSYQFWKRYFERSTNVVGLTLDIDHRATTIVGVMPPDFRFPDKDAELWLLLSSDSRWPTFQRVRYADAFCAVARLRPGVSVKQASGEMNAIAERLGADYPATDAGLGIRVMPLADQVASPKFKRALWLLFAAVLTVLLIACANVANLLLARGSTRRKEFAVQAALGATRWRIARQLLVEGILLSTTAGVLGVACAATCLNVLISLSPVDLPGGGSVSIDVQVLVFAFSLAAATGLLSAIASAWQQAISAPQAALREVGRGSSSGPGARRLRSLFVAAQYGLALVLLVCASLMIRSLEKLGAVDLGFNAKGLILVESRLPFAGYDSPDKARAFLEQAVERIGAVAGVKEVAVGSAFAKHVPNTVILVEGRESAASEATPNASKYVSPGYFHLLGIPLIQGRGFSNEDRANTTPVAVINESMARKFWKEESPLGKRFTRTLPGLNAPWVTVVGVVGDALRYGPESEVDPCVYEPLNQAEWPEMALVVRTTLDARTITPGIREAVRSTGSNPNDFNFETAEQELEKIGSQRRFQTAMLFIFAGLALFLAATGVYTVMHYTVAERSREVGIRIALGAARRDLLLMVFREGLLSAIVGMAVGVLFSLAVSRGISGSLYRTTPTDPGTYVFVDVLLLAVAAGGTLIPAWTATRVDPIQVLRQE